MTLHVSDGLSVYRQEFKTVHTTTGICQTDAANCLLASSWQLVHPVGFTIEIRFWVLLFSVPGLSF